MRNSKRYLGIAAVLLVLSGAVLGCERGSEKGARGEEPQSPEKLIEEGKVEWDYFMDDYKMLGLALSEYSASDFDESGEIEFQTEYPVIDERMESISCMISNHTGEDLEFGTEYALEVKGGEAWYQVPFPENMGWEAVAIVLPDGESFGKVINLEMMEYTFRDGEYRIVMRIGERLVKAEFRMGESQITPETPFGYLPLQELPEDYSLEEAVANGDVVFSFGETYNLEKLLHFVQNARLGLPAMVRLVSFTVEGDPIIYDIQRNVTYGGMEWYHFSQDVTRDGFSAPDDRTIWEQNYSYLVTDGRDLYLSNYAEYREDTGNWKEGRCIVFQDGLQTKEEAEEVWEQYETILAWTKEMTDKRLEGNSIRLKVMSPDGSRYVCLDKDQEKGGNSFGYGMEGYGDGDFRIPDAEGGQKVIVIVDFEWLNDEEVRLHCRETLEISDGEQEEQYFTMIFRPGDTGGEASLGERNYEDPYLQGLSYLAE